MGAGGAVGLDCGSEYGPGKVAVEAATSFPSPGRRMNAVNRAVEASFNNVDDLLWQERHGSLASRGPIRLTRSGRVAPLIELAIAQMAMPAAYSEILVEAPFAKLISSAIHGTISGNAYADKMGVFPLSRHRPGSSSHEVWEQWAHRAQNAAVESNFPRALVAGLIGALGELQDNVYEHSGKPDSGLVAYAVSPSAFEFIVADGGMGALASLHMNPAYAHLKTTAEALELAMSDRASRFGSDTGRGYGIGTLFKALAQDAGELRFRSGDYAIWIEGDRPPLTGRKHVVQKAWLDGFAVSVRCTLPNGPNNGRA